MIKNYKVINKIYESATSLVYRGIFLHNHQPIVLKILKDNYPTPLELIRYKQEYEMTRSLQIDGVIKVYGLERYKNSLVIFVEDFGGQSLNLNFLKSQYQFNLERFLSIAIKIAESLGEIHKANIIHKDINPSNIVYNQQTGQVKIIDLGIASYLSQENQRVLNPNQLEGTLAYMAPEQTGRMNQDLDCRSDFYSLGVTFYELLTNQLPFETEDAMELVHCHIAQHPPKPHELISSIPLAVSNIIMKLLSKTPEQRYQSDRGIIADLENCLTQLRVNGTINQFPLGKQDISERFNIPQKLYGRDREIRQLLITFKRISQGYSELVLISGASGIGKSALVNEISKSISFQGGFFIKGKFEQLKRDIPYSAFIQAFQSLIDRLLIEPEINLKLWRKNFLDVLGVNAQILGDFMPKLKELLGQHSRDPSAKISLDTYQNQLFDVSMKKFIEVVTSSDHPLVIFLDDLQWSDLQSIKFIELLIIDMDIRNLLVIGSYRNNEVGCTHPLNLLLERLYKTREQKAKVTKIKIQPLKFNHVNQIIADTLQCSRKITQDLAKLITQKTQGNPFFIKQLLNNLYKKN